MQVDLNGHVPQLYVNITIWCGFRFSGLWLIKILKGSDIGPEIKPEAELGAETFVLLQNFCQALAAKAQGVSFKIGAQDLRICFSA